MRPPDSPLSDLELERLDEAALFHHLLAMRDAGQGDAATRALWFVLHRRLRWVRAKLRNRLPDDVAEEQVVVVLARAVGSSFDGSSPGELVNWLKTIVSRTIADYHRGAEGRQLRDDRAGAASLGGGDEGGRDREDGAEDAGFEMVELGQIVETVLARRSPEHRAAIRAAYFEDLPARTVAERTGLGEANVYQLVTRFKADCRAEADTGGAR